MKIVILLAALLATTVVFGQCPFPSNLTSTGICPGGVLTVLCNK